MNEIIDPNFKNMYFLDSQIRKHFPNAVIALGIDLSFYSQGEKEISYYLYVRHPEWNVNERYADFTDLFMFVMRKIKKLEESRPLMFSDVIKES